MVQMLGASGGVLHLGLSHQGKIGSAMVVVTGLPFFQHFKLKAVRGAKTVGHAVCKHADKKARVL